MSKQRKPADKREKDLRLAMFRIQRGRAHTDVEKLSISSVAREAGVSASLIHNHYPDIAEAIRLAQGAAAAHSVTQSDWNSRQSAIRPATFARRPRASAPM